MKKKLLKFVPAKLTGKLLLITILLFSISQINAQTTKWKWICYGDTRTNDDAHRSVLQAIVKNTPDYKFLINVGDVVEDGRSTSLWDTWQKACSDILGGTGQDQYPPKYMAVSGNHDQLMSTGLPNWNKYLPGQAKMGNDGKYFYFDYENARFVIMNTEDQYTSPQKQMLLDAIANNPKPWLFLIWHKPIFNFGAKVYEGVINQEWGVPLYKYGCDVIFNGHAHIYVRTKKLNMNGQQNPPFDDVNGITTVITGNSGAPLMSVNENQDGNAYLVDYSFDQAQSGYYGYTELEMDGDTMYLKHIRASDSKVMDQTTLKANFKISNATANLKRFKINTAVEGQGTIDQTPSDSVHFKDSLVTLTAKGALGWKFDSWSGDLSGTANPAVIKVDTTKYVTAKFVQVEGKYELRAEWEGAGKIVLDPAGPYYDPGTKVNVKAVPNDSLNKLVKWDDASLGTTAEFTVTMDAHKAIKAYFKNLIEYNPRLRGSLHGSVNTDAADDEVLEGTVLTMTAVPEQGYEFLEWTGDKTGNKNPDTLLINCEKDVRAIFKKTGGSVFKINPAEDTYVRGGLMYSGKNFNPDTTLRVYEGASDSYRCRSFLKFNLKGIKGNILSAILKMKVKPGGLPNGAPVMANAYYVSSDTWSEGILKWTGATQTGTELDSYLIINQTGYTYSWDVTDKVNQEAASDSLITFMIKDNESTNRIIDFYSRETSGSPELLVVTDQTSGVSENGKQVPDKYSLEQNYPNPFNPATEIKYSLAKPGNVKLTVFDIMGREVAVLFDGFRPAGFYSQSWQAKDKTGHKLSSGIYICSMESAGISKSIKMMLLQ